MHEDPKVVEVDRVRHLVRSELDRLGVERIIDPALFTIVRDGEDVAVLSPNEVVVIKVPVWTVAPYSRDRLVELVDRAASGVGLEPQPWTPIDLPDSNWVTAAMRDGLELHFHRSALVECWPEDEPVMDETPAPFASEILP